jgi:hypothetical protein
LVVQKGKTVKPCQQTNKNWLVVSTPLKNISQWEGLSHILWKTKNVASHQPENKRNTQYISDMTLAGDTSQIAVTLSLRPLQQCTSCSSFIVLVHRQFSEPRPFAY